jgi:hypothetical protein
LIVQRGHNPCFFAEDDYLAYLHWLDDKKKRDGFKRRRARKPDLS